MSLNREASAEDWGEQYVSSACDAPVLVIHSRIISPVANTRRNSGASSRRRSCQLANNGVGNGFFFPDL